ncbi:MAG: pyridoxal phosphate-dependent aminotransferase family protein [Bdellovibrionaceae bacterium]|nr:pyridoxal phosphate-dependent aminotransferase family protein [Pseudobdellovibrionaceae bacterium]
MDNTTTWNDNTSDAVNLLTLASQFKGQIDADVDFFESYFRPLYNEGKLLYHREIISPVDRRVLVKDPMTGKTIDMIMMGSNNYLGFANDPEVKEKAKEAIDKQGLGMGGPMLLNGTSQLHRTVEERLAHFKGKEDCIILPSGYMTSLTWVTTLVSDSALLFFDEISHASVVDGIKLGRKTAFRFNHNDPDDLDKMLKKYRDKDAKRDLWVTTQGVYSMNGELAPVKEISDVCQKYDAKYVIDDAHGTGVMGKGRGMAEEAGITDRLQYAMGTFSKAFSITGGFFAADKNTINFLRFFSRPYFFTASLSPVSMAVILACLDILERSTERVDKLHANIKFFYDCLDKAGIKYTRTGSAIIPVFPPTPESFRVLSQKLHENGLFVNPIEPPGVPKGGERFRVSLMATHTQKDIQDAVDILKSTYARYA